MLSMGAHNPGIPELFTEEPKDELQEEAKLKLPENAELAYNSAEPEKDVGIDSHEEKEKENSGYVAAQAEEKENSDEDPQDVIAEVSKDVSAAQDPENDPVYEKDN